VYTPGYVFHTMQTISKQSAELLAYVNESASSFIHSVVCLATFSNPLPK